MEKPRFRFSRISASIVSASTAFACTVFGSTVLAVCLFHPAPAKASNTPTGSGDATLQGSTLLPDGKPVPGAQISLRCLDDQVELKLVSDSSGAFAFRELKAGHYELQATKESVGASASTRLELAAAQTFRSDLTLSQTASPGTSGATPPASPLRRWGTEFSFFLDGYIDGNFHSPPSGFNGLRAFDVRSDTAHVNMGMITIDHAAAPVGFRLDVGFGDMFNTIHTGTRDPEAWKYFKQAYVSLKPKSWHGVEIDAGEFTSSAGAEVIETNQNFNYSRTLLFAYAVPYTHTGLRLQYPVGAHFTGTFQVVNGWNNVEPLNSGKTYGITGAYAWKKVTWSHNYYGGPAHPHTTTGWRNLYDTSVAVNQTENFSWYLNFDYGRDKNVGAGASKWAGIAGAARYALGKNYAVAARVEWMNDPNGLLTGTAQSLKEFTLTGEYKFTGWLMTRAELRTDWSNRPFFDAKNQPGGAKTQPTALIGLIASFAPKK